VRADMLLLIKGRLSFSAKNGRHQRVPKERFLHYNVKTRLSGVVARFRVHPHQLAVFFSGEPYNY